MKIKINILLAIIILTVCSSFADDRPDEQKTQDCIICTPNPVPDPNPLLKKESGNISKIVLEIAEDPFAIISNASLYLQTINKNNSFSENEINAHIEKLTPYCESSKLAKGYQADACLKLAGLNGAIARKKGIFGGATYGIEAHKYIRKTLEINPNHREAIESYALAILGILEQNRFIQGLITTKLGIGNIKDETKKTIKKLEDLNLTKTSAYLHLVAANNALSDP